MALKMFDYAKFGAMKSAQKLSSLSAPLQSFITALIAEEAWCKDYFNHGDTRDPNTNGGRCMTGVDVSIYYAPCTDREYNAGEVLSIKSDTIWASGRRRVALRKDGDVHKIYLANHTGKSAGGMRDNSTYIYIEVNVAA